MSSSTTASAYGVLANTLAGKYDRANPTLGGVGNFHSAVGYGPRSKVRIAADLDIMFDDRAVSMIAPAAI